LVTPGLPHEWESLNVIERDVWLTRLALACIREVLSLPLPSADDVSVAAQEERELQLHAAQLPLAHVRRAKEQLVRSGATTDLSEVLREIAAFGTVH
jgi:hypothetical protein